MISLVLTTLCVGTFWSVRDISYVSFFLKGIDGEEKDPSVAKMINLFGIWRTYAHVEV